MGRFGIESDSLVNVVGKIYTGGIVEKAAPQILAIPHLKNI